MTTEATFVRRKLSLLELAGELNNVSKACKIVGYSRQQFYEIRPNSKLSVLMDCSIDSLEPKAHIRIESARKSKI